MEGRVDQRVGAMIAPQPGIESTTVQKTNISKLNLNIFFKLRKSKLRLTAVVSHAPFSMCFTRHGECHEYQVKPQSTGQITVYHRPVIYDYCCPSAFLLFSLEFLFAGFHF